MTITIQAGCVAIGGRGVLILGAPGAGKSSLALGLIDRGAQLVGDDGVVVEQRGDRLLASPAPHTRGLIEVRNLGIVEMPVADGVPVCLALTLAEDAPRFVDAPGLLELEGMAVPHLVIEARSANLAIKAEIALSHYGLAAN